MSVTSCPAEVAPAVTLIGPIGAGAMPGMSIWSSPPTLEPSTNCGSIDLDLDRVIARRQRNLVEADVGRHLVAEGAERLVIRLVDRVAAEDAEPVAADAGGRQSCGSRWRACRRLSTRRATTLTSWACDSPSEKKTVPVIVPWVVAKLPPPPDRASRSRRRRRSRASPARRSRGKETSSAGRRGRRRTQAPRRTRH